MDSNNLIGTDVIDEWSKEQVQNAVHFTRSDNEYLITVRESENQYIINLGKYDSQKQIHNFGLKEAFGYKETVDTLDDANRVISNWLLKFIK